MRLNTKLKSLKIDHMNITKEKHNNMSWQDTIKFGMQIIANGCNRNIIDSCEQCPFNNYCEAINIGATAHWLDVKMPENWLSN